MLCFILYLLSSWNCVGQYFTASSNCFRVMGFCFGTLTMKSFPSPLILGFFCRDSSSVWSSSWRSSPLGQEINTSKADEPMLKEKVEEICFKNLCWREKWKEKKNSLKVKKRRRGMLNRCKRKDKKKGGGKKKISFPLRESNPGRLGESQES